MKLTLKMDLDGGAFEPFRNHETARILRTLERQLTSTSPLEPGDEFPLLDANGNRVGRAVVS